MKKKKTTQLFRNIDEILKKNFIKANLTIC